LKLCPQLKTPCRRHPPRGRAGVSTPRATGKWSSCGRAR
jgi:hypothetical protein